MDSAFTPSDLQVLVLEATQARAVAPDDERQQLVLVLECECHVQRVARRVARVRHHGEEVVADAVLVTQVLFLALLELHLKLKQ